MDRVLLASSILGALAVAESFGLMYIGKTLLDLDQPHLQTMMFLQLVAGGHLMLFLTRSQGPLWMPPFPAAKLFGAIVGTQVFAILMCGFGWLVPALSWILIGWVWVYNLVWMIVQDVIKLAMYWELDRRRTGRHPFLARLNTVLHPHGGLHQ